MAALACVLSMKPWLPERMLATQTALQAGFNAFIAGIHIWNAR